MRLFISHSILLLLPAILGAPDLFDDSVSYEPFLVDSAGSDVSLGSVDDSTAFSADQTVANAYPNCVSDSNVDNLFLPDVVARKRRRRDGETCRDPSAPLPPLPPVTNIYDPNAIIDELSSPSTGQSAGPTKQDLKDLERAWQIGGFDPNAKDDDDVCPKAIVGDSQTPVCTSTNTRRDASRLAGENHYTLYNVRLCKSSTFMS